MPKIKTIRSVSKRFKKTGTGKFKHKQANMRHILTKKTSKLKSKLRKKKLVSFNDIKVIKKCIPYN